MNQLELNFIVDYPLPPIGVMSLDQFRTLLGFWSFSPVWCCRFTYPFSRSRVLFQKEIHHETS